MSALTVFLITSFIGFALVCAGVYMLVGIGWALIAGGMSFFLIAGFIKKGMTHGG